MENKNLLLGTKSDVFFEVESYLEQENSESFGENNDVLEIHNLLPNDILKIEESVFHSWGGVTSCNHDDRIKSECWGAVTNWAKNKMFEYRHGYSWISYGNESHTVRTSQYKDPVTNKRSCHSRTSIPCYIEFRRL